ncbi:MAG: hypothetical protein J5586_06865 [Clostridia bacterium]|nr:hypothetical protein [Clostridia bacterium]
MKTVKKAICLLIAVLLASAVPAFASGAKQYDEHDAAALRAFFEQVGPDGVKNGEKLFDNYDPDDPASWKGRSDFVDDRPERVIWDEDGRLTQLAVGCEDADLYGTLDVSGCTGLIFLECGNGKLTALCAAGCGSLQIIEAGGNEIASADLSGCTDLRELRMQDNRLSDIDLTSSLRSLVTLILSNNEFESFDLTGMDLLKDLVIDGNRLVRLTAPADNDIYMVNAENNELREVELQGGVKVLRLAGNPIEKLDLSACTSLETIGFVDCPLKELVISKDGGTTSIVSEGGTFSGRIELNTYAGEMDEETCDMIAIDGVPEGGYEYRGVFDAEGNLICGPGEWRYMDKLPVGTLRAVFEGNSPEETAAPTDTPEATEEPETTETADTETPAGPTEAPAGSNAPHTTAIILVAAAAVICVGAAVFAALKKRGK